MKKNKNKNRKKKQTPLENLNRERWWIALNGASCARCFMPLRWPFRVTPTPQQLIGFLTEQEAKSAQSICLTAPMSDVVDYLASLADRVRDGEIVVILPPNPEPHGDNTFWTQE
jgi:hypothetical protein